MTLSPLCFDPAACPLCELTQHVRDTHHVYLRAELPVIWDLLREAASSSVSGHAEIRSFGTLFGRFRAALENHLRKEDDVLFPLLDRLGQATDSGAPPPRYPFGSIAYPIDVLEAEHVLGDRLLDRMRPMWQRWAGTADAPPWQHALQARMVQLDADMQRHVHVEDAILFPRAIRLEAERWPAPAVSF